MQKKSIISAFIFSITIIITVLTLIFGIIAVTTVVLEIWEIEADGKIDKESNNYNSKYYNPIIGIKKKLNNIDIEIYQIIESHQKSVIGIVNDIDTTNSIFNPEASEIEIIEYIFNAIADNKIVSFCLISKDGKVIIDSKNLLEGNIERIRDSRGKLIAPSLLESMEKHKFHKFTNYIDEKTEYYYICSQLENKDYYLGLGMNVSKLKATKRENAVEYLVGSSKKLANFNGYTIIDFDGNIIYENNNDGGKKSLKISDEDLNEYVKNASETLSIQVAKHDELGELHYIALPEIKWIVYYTLDKDAQLANEVVLAKYQTLTKVIVFSIIIVFVIIVIIFVLTRVVKNNIAKQLAIFKFADENRSFVDISEITYTEFAEVGNYYNKALNDRKISFENSEKKGRLEKNNRRKYDVLGFLTATLFGKEIFESELEQIPLMQLLENCVREFSILGNNQIQLICEKDLFIISNRELFISTCKFLLTNLLLSEYDLNREITIEVMSGKNDVFLSFAKEIKSDVVTEISDSLIEKFEYLDTILRKHAGATIDISGLKFSDKKIVVQYPIKRNEYNILD